jgi:hypothetical protein
VEYKPLTIAALEATKGAWLGPVSFKISAASHEKTVRLLNQHTTERPMEYHHLLPSELWGCARVLSNYFGRLNEIAVSRTRWELQGMPFPGQQVQAKSRVVKTEVRKDLSYATIETVTSSEDSSGRMDHLRQLDELLLFHEIPSGWKYQERLVKDNEGVDLTIPRILYFRHNWDPALWKNNIHTNDYAREWGYERALPEFITYLDQIFDAFIRKTKAYAGGFIIDVPLILPLYERDNFEVRLRRESREKYAVRFAKENQLRLRGTVLLL